MTIKLEQGSAITVFVEVKDGKSGRLRIYKIAYIADTVPESAPRIAFDKADNLIVIGIGNRNLKESNLARDVANDIIKGIGCNNSKSVKKHAFRLRKIDRIEFIGYGTIKKLTLSNHCYETNFFNAAEWLYENLTPEGKWPIQVEKELDNYPTLNPGWCSAMAQGHGLSVLVRAAQITGETRFWDAAKLALKPFTQDAKDGGVRNKFMNQYTWYEEYPFSDGLYVLNGFMYSMIGLYDLFTADGAPEELHFTAKEIFDLGFESLKQMLPLYDNGKGTNYDMRHYIKSIAPNRARWDYHVVHVHQLNLFKSIFKEETIFSEFAARWHGYINGHYADHN